MGSTPRFIAIVRQGETRTFRALQQEFREELQAVRVIWDRRRGERRRTPGAGPPPIERRRGDRRQHAPREWDTMGFIVVPARAGGEDAS